MYIIKAAKCKVRFITTHFEEFKTTVGLKKVMYSLLYSAITMHWR